MAAANNDSQGLKIAVAVFVTLTVIMAVSLYFAYKSYSETDALLTKARSDEGQAKKAADAAQRGFEELQKSIGFKASSTASDLDAGRTEMKNEYAKVDKEIQTMIEQVTAAISQAQTAGASGTELEDAKTKVGQIAASYRAEPNKTYISAVARLTDLLKNLSMLTARMSLNYVDVKRGLEGANGVNAQKLGVSEETVAKAKADLAAEQKSHLEQREILITKVDQFTTENSRLAAELASATAKIRQMEDDFGKKLGLSQQTLREYRAQLEKSEVVLDRPDGKVTYVDYIRGEIHCDLRAGTGARPQMVFAIFDARSAGLPTEHPKASVELISVGPTSSIAKIIKTEKNIDPIKIGDFVYSGAWSANEPTHFALIGKIDINRDGKDDRADLKRMIEAAGGVVDYDLPPSYVGKESGKLTGRDAWYVIDDRKTLRQQYTTVKDESAADEERFSKQKSEVIKEARLNGVRPMPIERLLPYLGYDFAAVHTGRAEAKDPAAMSRWTQKQGAAATKPVNPDADKAPEDKPEEKAKPEEMPKEEPK